MRDRHGWLLVTIFTFAMLFGLMTRGGPLRADFVNWLAAGRIVDHGETSRLYDLDVELAEQRTVYPHTPGDPFNYPPYLALAFAPLGLLPPIAAAALYVVLQAALLAWLARAVARRHGRWDAVVPIFAFSPLAEAIGFGQLTPVLLCAWFAFAWAWEDRRELPAGIAVALIATKPPLAMPLAVALLAAGRWRALAIAAGIVTSLWVVSIAILGGSVVAGYARMLWLSGTVVGSLGLHPLLMVNLRALLAWSGLGGSTTTVAVVAWLAALIAIAWIARCRRSDAAASFAAIGALAVFTCPHLYTHDAAFLTASFEPASGPAANGLRRYRWLIGPAALLVCGGWFRYCALRTVPNDPSRAIAVAWTAGAILSRVGRKWMASAPVGVPSFRRLALGATRNSTE